MKKKSEAMKERERERDKEGWRKSRELEKKVSTKEGNF